MKNRFIITVAFFLLMINGVAQAYAAQPIDSVKSTVEGIIGILTDANLKEAGRADERRDKLLSLIDQRFNFPLMARLALGRGWDVRSEVERQGFIRLFSDLLKNTYLRRIETYSEETVVFSRQDVKKNLAKVYSQFLKNNSGFSIVYKLKKRDDDWLIFDIVIEGASVIKQYRRQFSQIIKNEQFEGLMQRLEKKVKITTVSS